MWQPISTAPRDGTRILVCGGMAVPEVSDSWPIAEATKAEFTFGRWYVADTRGYSVQIDGPAYWMPLPPPGEPSYQSEHGYITLGSIFAYEDKALNESATRSIQGIYVAKRHQGLSEEDALNECATFLLQLLSGTKEG